LDLPGRPAETGGSPWKSIKEQELSDLTASILTTFHGMSNMFLQFRQVIDSRLQKGVCGEESYGTARQLNLLS
jgi:hypothetical protein